jgi:hypothetical protein
MIAQRNKNGVGVVCSPVSRKRFATLPPASERVACHEFRSSALITLIQKQQS